MPVVQIVCIGGSPWQAVHAALKYENANAKCLIATQIVSVRHDLVNSSGMISPIGASHNSENDNDNEIARELHLSQPARQIRMLSPSRKKKEKMIWAQQFYGQQHDDAFDMARQEDYIIPAPRITAIPVRLKWTTARRSCIPGSVQTKGYPSHWPLSPCCESLARTA